MIEKRATLPMGAFLEAYRDAGAHTDCYTTVVGGARTLQSYVAAFYTTPLFRAERFILARAVSKPSTDEDVKRLVSGTASNFAAWTVERRAEDQLLMCDYVGRTRSWFMITPETDAGNVSTRLFFGSAVVPLANEPAGQGLPASFKAMLWFHHMYSILLLRGARAALIARNPD